MSVIMVMAGIAISEFSNTYPERLKDVHFIYIHLADGRALIS